MEAIGPLIFSASFGQDMGQFIQLVFDALPSVFVWVLRFSPLLEIK